MSDSPLKWNLVVLSPRLLVVRFTQPQLPGDVDLSEYEQLWQRLDQRFSSPGVVILNFEAVFFLDSRFIASLMYAQLRFDARGLKLIACQLRRELRETFSTDDGHVPLKQIMFEAAETEDAAISQARELLGIKADNQGAGEA